MWRRVSGCSFGADEDMTAIDATTKLGDLTVGQVQGVVVSYSLTAIICVSLLFAVVFACSALTEWRQQRRRQRHDRQ